jgi:hypothetical protein
MITIDITRVVGRFITGMITTEVEANAGELPASAAELAPASTKGTGRQTGTRASAAELVLASTKGTGRQTGTRASAAEPVPASTKGTGRQTGTRASAAELVLASTKGTGRQTGTRASAAELVLASTKGTGHQAGTRATAAEMPTDPARRRGLSTVIPRLLEGTVNLAVRAVFARAPSAGTTMADKQGAIRHAEAPASVAEQHMAAVAASIGNRSFVVFLVVRKT